MPACRRARLACVVAVLIVVSTGATANAAPDTVIGFDDIPASTTPIVDQYAGVGVEFGHPHRWGIDFGIVEGCGGEGAGLGGQLIMAGGIAGQSLDARCTGRAAVDSPEDKGFATGWRFAVERRRVTFRVRASPNPSFTAQPGPWAVSVRFLGVTGAVISQESLILATGAVTTVTRDSSPTQNIAYVILTGPAGRIEIDDIVATLDDVPPPPKFSIALEQPTLDLIEGDTGSVNVRAVRFNGSTGVVPVSIGALPAGIVAAVPDPLGGTAPAPLKVTAASPATGDRQITVSSASAAGAGTFVGSTLNLTARIGTALSLDRTTLGVTPGCGANVSNVAAVVRGNYTGDVTMSLLQLGGPATVTFRSVVRATGNGTILFPTTANSPPTESPSTYEVTLTPVGATPVKAGLAVFAGAANSVRISGLDSSSAYVGPGNAGAAQVVVRGNFPESCRVTFRNDFGTTLERLPGTASRAPEQDEGIRVNLGPDPVSTRIHAVNAAGVELAVSSRIAVSEYRNVFAPRQVNGGAGARYANFNWQDFLRAFGTDDGENCFDFACWRSPTAVAYYERFLAQVTATPGAGLCFGWAAQSISLFTKAELVSQLTPGANSGYAISNWGDETAAKRNVAVWHVRQFDKGSQTSLIDQVNSPLSAAALRQRIDDALAQNRPPIIGVWRNRYGTPGNAGHAVVAIGTRTVDGVGYDILTYNPNTPFTAAEQTTAATRTANLAASRIRVTSAGRWSGGIAGWSGPMAQIQVASAPPLNAALPLDLPTVATNFRSSEISQITIDGKDALRPDRTVIAGRGVADASIPTGGLPVRLYRLTGDAPATLEVAGTRGGTYSASLLGGEVAATVTGAPTRKGQRDTFRVQPDGARVTFAGGGAASTTTLGLVVNQAAGKSAKANEGATGPSRSAQVALTAGRGRSDTISLAGTLALQHTGPPTTATVTLQNSPRSGLPGSVTFAPIAVGTGERLSVRPDSWANLGAGGAYTVADTAGRVLRSGRATARPTTTRLAPSLTLATTKLARGRGRVTVTGRVLGLGKTPRLVIRAVVRQGGRVVATSTVTRSGRGKVRAGQVVVPVSVRRLPAGARVEVVATLLDDAVLAAARARGQATVR